MRTDALAASGTAGATINTVAHMPTSKTRMMTVGILEAVHETARGLAKAGVMDTLTLREFDALCLPPIRAYSADKIRAIVMLNTPRRKT